MKDYYPKNKPKRLVDYDSFIAQMGEDELKEKIKSYKGKI